MAGLRRYQVLIAGVAAALLGLAAPLAAQEPPSGLYDRPVLALDPGMHTAMINRADVDAAGATAVTGSDDKTLRFWSMADGQLLRMIRLPAGPGNVGKVYAVAISPNGETVAAGGWTRKTKNDPQEQIYLLDSGTGALIGRLDGLPGVVLHLAFSPDGTRLAAALGSGRGLRVYGRTAAGGWREAWRDEAYDDQSYGAAFAENGRLATTSYDGRLRLYDVTGQLIGSEETGLQPFGLAFNPVDGRLAVGFYGAPEVRLYDGATLEPLPGPDLYGLDNGDLSSVAWSADGARLFAAGGYQEAGGSPVIVWEASGAGPRRTLPAGSSTVMSLRPLPDGGLLAAAGDPWLGALLPDGATRWRHAPAQIDPRDQMSTLGVSADGLLVDFGLEPWGEARMRFDVAALTLVRDPTEDHRTSQPEQKALEITDWRNGLAPALAETPLALKPYETSRSLAIAPGGQRFLLGADWSLRAFDAQGAELWNRPVPGMVWAVNVAGDGRLAVAAYGDGTLRWHRMEDGAEILALFPFADGTDRWVLWTPEGYYAAAPGAAAALGWSVNRGWDRPADFFPITAFGGFFEPDAVRHVPEALETPRALGLAKVERDRKFVQQVVDSPAPPGPQLHVLTIGVSRYANHESLALDFADDDATALASELLRQDGGLYARVNLARPLIDGEATQRAILDEMLVLERRMTPDQQDVAIILFSGHGTRIGKDYYLLPTDVDASDEGGITATALDIDLLLKLIGRMGDKGKVLVLLDACHSGSVADGAKSATPPDIADVRAELAAAGAGVIVLSSSTGTELSREHPDWKQGAFTKAILEALRGQGDSDGDGWLTVSELEGHVVKQVRALTKNGQNPTITVPGGRHYQARLFRTAF